MGTLIKYHSKVGLTEPNFSVKLGCKSIGFPYTILESTNILDVSYAIGFHGSEPLKPVETSTGSK